MINILLGTKRVVFVLLIKKVLEIKELKSRGLLVCYTLQLDIVVSFSLLDLKIETFSRFLFVQN